MSEEKSRRGQWRRSEGWTKIWDPNKHNKYAKEKHKDKSNRASNREMERTEASSRCEIGSTDYSSHIRFSDNCPSHMKIKPRPCCGGVPCIAARKKGTLDDFGKELFNNALTPENVDKRNQNRELASKYNLPFNLVENLRDVFSKFDYDHDGTVSGKEILDVFRTMGAIFTRQQCDDVIKAFLGGNITGEIDFEEMIQMFAQRKSNPKNYQQDLELAFKMFDLDGDGYVCAEDLKGVMKMLGNDLSDEEIRTIYSHLDTDDNGLIDFWEFESILYPDIKKKTTLKKQPKRSPQPTKPATSTTVKATTPRPNVPSKLGVMGAVRTNNTGGGGLYNAFYSDQQQKGNQETPPAQDRRRRRVDSRTSGTRTSGTRTSGTRTSGTNNQRVY